MANTTNPHTFHIPVMGLGYTIDSPIRVAALGISSAISIMDDDLIEKMNAFYSNKFDMPYREISKKVLDYRAERITSYLNLVDKIVRKKFEDFKTELVENKTALDNYLATLPNKCDIRKGIQNLMEEGLVLKDTIREFIEKKLVPGSIDVNIMTKVDKDNFDSKNQLLPVMYNDAHAALRGFANSTLNSSVILSAGMNPRLYSYFENFSDFFPDSSGNFKKKIILKVSDFRSASIQGSFLAKKGLWVSEYRIESGLNCGGHAFATDGLLLGPIMEEFLHKREELAQSTFELITKALLQKGLMVPDKCPNLKITVQGGVGTAEEHEFLLDHYNVASVGWGSPFLLVPEATAVDKATRELLANAKEDDLYLSDISPLGIPFNSVKGTTNDLLKQKRAAENKLGSSCPKKYLALNKEFSGQAICTASRKYQEKKLQEHNLNVSETEVVTHKSCLCVGLANPALLEMGLPVKGEAQGVVVCPGPNMAYFTQEVSLARMIKHIYGNDNIIEVANRPHFFLKELGMYIAHFKKEIQAGSLIPAQLKKLHVFKENLQKGIAYYEGLFAETSFFKSESTSLQLQLQEYKSQLHAIQVTD